MSFRYHAAHAPYAYAEAMWLRGDAPKQAPTAAKLEALEAAQLKRMRKLEKSKAVQPKRRTP